MAIASPRWGEVHPGKHRAETSGESFLEITLSIGRLKDTLHVGIQPNVELRIGLLGCQPLD